MPSGRNSIDSNSNNLHLKVGWIILDKPIGLSSAQALGIVRRRLNIKKAGHAGTLDPFATGVLVIGLNQATKCIPFVMDMTKEYEFELSWGTATDTGDCDGTVTEQGGEIPDNSEIDRVLPEFFGQIQQRPPSYSACKVGGRRAYALARAGHQVELDERTVRVDWIRRPDGDDRTGTSRFLVSCGQGTYIRSLGADIARRLGTHAHVSALCRHRVGPFHLSSASKMRSGPGNRIPEHVVVLPVGAALLNLIRCEISESAIATLRHGGIVDAIRSGQSASAPHSETHHLNTPSVSQGGAQAINAYAASGDDIQALGKLQGRKFHPRRLLTTDSSD